MKIYIQDLVTGLELNITEEVKELFETQYDFEIGAITCAFEYAIARFNRDASEVDAYSK